MLKIGICGFGTVGQSLVDHILIHKNKIKSNVSSDFGIAMIADRSIEKKEYPNDIKVTTDPMDLSNDSTISIVIELLGGIELPYKIIIESIKNKKHPSTRKL